VPAGRGVRVNTFDTAAILIAIAAASGYLNHRVLRLPASSGTLGVALASSLAILVADAVVPGWHLREALAGFLSHIDFNETLMQGMLAFLLFAGALHLNLEGLLAHKWTIGALSTVGVLTSTAIIAVLSWGVFHAMNLEVRLISCAVLGALISPTDPVAVMGLLKELRAPASLESQIGGESLFNDGVGVVLFFALVSIAGLTTDGAVMHLRLEPLSVSVFFLREVLGGALLGAALGYVAYRALKSIDDHPLELLITVALVFFTYSMSFRMHVSGPIAVVTAGVLIGNPGRQFAMSPNTREHVDAFWSMIDEILNAILFLLIGLQVFAVPAGANAIVAGLLLIPIALVARYISVALPVTAIRRRRPFVPGIIPVLTWSGLRGGISVAMVLSLPPFGARDLFLTCTYAVVVFSILVQGLTVRRVLLHYGICETPSQ
jgi:Na+:H+ antiporter